MNIIYYYCSNNKTVALGKYLKWFDILSLSEMRLYICTTKHSDRR